MRTRASKIIDELLPPMICRFIKKRGISLSREYRTWQEASLHSSGYGCEKILKKVFAASMKVKKGEAVYERDSVLFDEIQYSWPVLSGLMWIAAQYKGVLNIMDFGGSLGTTYFQNRKFLEALPRVRWNVIEQKQFVDVGREHFEDEKLKFYYDIHSCLNDTEPKGILLSGVLQYLEKPYLLLKSIREHGIPLVLIDRTSFMDSNHDRVFVQKVAPSIFEASYPCWAFGIERFRKSIGEYEILAEFEGFESEPGGRIRFKGFILKTRT